MSFSFEGPLHSSKSIVNRLLILQKFFPGLGLGFHTKAKDVLDLQRLFKEFNDGNTEFFVGEGGTTFRFFSFFLASQKGDWTLRLAKNLSQRPHEDLVSVLNKVGVKAEFTVANKLKIYGRPWDLKKPISLDLSKSTQFFSGFILSAIGSQKSSVKISIKNQNQSSSYEQITWDILKKIGCQIEEHEKAYKVLPPPKGFKKQIEVGADWSSIFYLALFAFSGSEIKITNVDMESSEPDIKGLNCLKDVGLEYETHAHSLHIKPSVLNLQKSYFDFRKNPDLFPGFCALLSQLDERQIPKEGILLYFPWQLTLKESDRLENSLEFFRIFNFKFEIQEDNKLVILDKTFAPKQTSKFETHRDHRILMSLEFLRSLGYDFTSSDKTSHKKSFAEFMEIVRG